MSAHRRLSWTCSLVTAALLCGVYPTSSEAAWKYYVRKSGSDSNHGKNPNHAFRSIDKARQVMDKGDVCWVGAGTYEETIKPNRDGLANAPIQFVADTTGEKTGDSGAVILASKNDFVISANSADYNEFYGFTIQKASSGSLLPAGVYANNSNGFALVNCTIKRVLVGVAADECNLSIKDCVIEDVLLSPILTYRNNTTVTGTTIRDCSSYAAFHFALSSSTDLLKFVDCTLENNYAGPYCSKTLMHLENTTIRNHSSWAAVLMDSNLTTVNMTAGIKDNGGGIYLSKSASPDLSGGIDSTDSLPVDYTISDIDFSNNENYGVYATNCIVSLLNCRFENHPEYAIGLEYAELRDATGTVIENNANGIVAWTDKNKRKVKIQKAEIAHSSSHAIMHYGSASTNDKIQLVDCNIHDNGGWSCYSEKGNFYATNSQFVRNGSGIRVTRPTSSSKIGTCSLENCTIDDIQSSDALYAHYSDVVLDDCTVSDTSGYGVQCYYGNLTVQDSTVNNVGQTEGYAVYHYHPGPVTASSPKMILRDSAFTNNDGGPYADKTNVTLDDVNITNNRSWALVVNYGSLAWTGTNAKIIRNNGQGLYIAGNDLGQTTRTFTGWQFLENDDYGVYALDCSLVLDNCVVDSMTGWGLGLEHASFSPINTPIQNNGKGIAVTTDGAHGAPVITGAVITNNDGVAISHESSETQPGKLIVTGCTVSDNAGWGLLSQHGNVEVSSTTFADNNQGLYLERDPQVSGAGTHLLTNVTVRDVSANDLVYVSGASLAMAHCVIENGPQSGVMCFGEDVQLQYCTIRNTASGYAVYHYYAAQDPSQRGDMLLDHCTITDNESGPYAHLTNVTVEDCQIEDNRQWGLISHQGEINGEAGSRVLSNNGYGMYVEGNPTADGRVIENWDLSNNGNYGIYAVDCDLKLINCTLEEMDDWGVGLVRSTLTAINSPIQNNGQGVEITSNATSRQPVLTGVEVESNAGIAIQHTTDPASPATLVMNDCQVTNNGGYALLSSDANLESTGSTFDGNGRGIRLQKVAALAGQGTHLLTNTTVQNHQAEAGVFAEYTPVQMTNCTVVSNAGHGVACYFADFRAESSTFTGNGSANGYGIYHEDSGPDRDLWADLLVQACTISNNGGGIYADHTHLTIDGCTLASNTSWAIGCAYGDLTFANQPPSVNGNGSGLLVMGNTADGERRLTGFDLSNNGNYGLFASDCDLVLENCQLTGMQDWALGMSDATIEITNTPITNNGNGVHIITSAATRAAELTGLQVIQTAGYAIYHESDSTSPGSLTVRSSRLENYGEYGLVNMHGSLTLVDVTLVGNPANSENGLYLFRSPQVTADRVQVLNHQNWGLLSYGSNLSLRNSLIGNNASGAYIYSYAGEDTNATIMNTTFGENAAYGLVQTNGISTIVNSIIATTTTGEIGLQLSSGVMDHSYNLFDGYAQPHSGTSAGEGEVQGPARFTNAAAGEFQLTGSSTAINRGTELSGVVDQDMLGFARPMFGKWDLGAYEYTSPSESAHIVEWQELK